MLSPSSWTPESVRYLLEHGERIRPRHTLYNALGVKGSCHLDAAEIWADDSRRRTVWTGFFCSPDGLWGEHSWVMVKGFSLIDPWPPEYAERLYFGVPIRTQEVGLLFNLGWCVSRPENIGLIELFRPAHT